jgi:hypothetical protein
MMATYRLNTNDISEKFIQLLQQSYSGKELEITVMEEDATEYLLSNPINETSITEAILRIENNEGLISIEPNNLFH